MNIELDHNKGKILRAFADKIQNQFKIKQDKNEIIYTTVHSNFDN